MDNEEMTKEQIDEMISKICKWLEENSQVPPGKLDGRYAETVRGYCNEMLEAANAYSAGGCPLCLG